MLELAADLYNRLMKGDPYPKRQKRMNIAPCSVS
jgi:hypothetical protein